MRYCYVYTGDREKEKRIKRIDKVLEKLKNKEIIYVVNDLQSIAYLKEKGYKALNIDAIEDLFNLLTPEDSVILCTPEKSEYLRFSFSNVEEICNE
jgi:hypothetical protein